MVAETFKVKETLSPLTSLISNLLEVQAPGDGPRCYTSSWAPHANHCGRELHTLPIKVCASMCLDKIQQELSSVWVFFFSLAKTFHTLGRI